MRAIPAPPELRATKWPLTGRYRRARAAQGLIFAGDVSGVVRKDTVARDWVEGPGRHRPIPEDWYWNTRFSAS